MVETETSEMSSGRNPSGSFATAAVIGTIDPAGSYPELGEGPGITLDEAFNVDMGVTRSFRVSGQRALQFRAELFNVLNSVQKGDPVATLNSPNFGLITTAADPRIVQLAVKFTF